VEKSERNNDANTLVSEEGGCCGFASICNKEPCSYSLTPSPSLVGWGGDSEGKKAKLVGWDENSLKEWQMEKKRTIINTDKKHIRHAMF